jgi:putative nucleotidyltransferase with HDIG domain
VTAPMSTPTLSRARELERALEEVQASRPAAVRVLQLADDPTADAKQVAAAIELDPMMTAQILRLANSAAFGMRSRVSSTQIAVSVLGFSAVRSIATLLAAGLRHNRHATPPGFWRHAAGTAAACSVVANRFGLARGDAFAIGLLHDLGVPILHSVDPEVHAQIMAMGEDTGSQCGGEVAEFGMSHAEAAARVLQNWNFPETFVEAIANHHDSALGATREEQVLIAGDALAHLVLTPSGVLGETQERIDAIGMDPASLEAAVGVIADYANEVFSALPTGDV